MKRYILATFVFLALLSCRKDDELDIQPLVGDWEWVSTTGGLNGTINDTPASTGNTIELSITEDHKYKITTNGNITQEGTITLYKDISNLDHVERTHIAFSAGQIQMIRNIDANNLYLSDDANDGVDTHYKK